MLHKPTERNVDFLICGTQKGGTTALYAYLRDHPQICMAKRKELHFFDNEVHFQSMKPDYSAYHAQFDVKPPHKIIGEASPIYMYWYDAPRRIWQYNPRIKLIVLLRNPVDRAFSHWNMERSRNMENLSFWDAIRNEGKRCRAALPLQHRVYSYVDRGFYLDQLRRIWTYFPKEQLLIISTDDLQQHAQATLDKVFSFLEVKSIHIENKNLHQNMYITTMDARERDFLLNQYEFEIKGLERELGWDCHEWLSEPNNSL